MAARGALIEVLNEMRRWEDAVAVYEDAVELFDRLPAPSRSQTRDFERVLEVAQDALRESGRHEAASAAAERAARLGKT